MIVSHEVMPPYDVIVIHKVMLVVGNTPSDVSILFQITPPSDVSTVCYR